MKIWKHPDTFKAIEEIRKLIEQNPDKKFPGGVTVQGIISNRLANGMTIQQILDWIFSMGKSK